MRRPLEPKQYTASGYTQRLRDAGIVPSRGRTGTAPDNAIAESAIATIKTELTKRQVWRSRLEFALPVYSGLYHERRLHRAPGGNTPAETAAAYHRDDANENSTTTEKTS